MSGLPWDHPDSDPLGDIREYLALYDAEEERRRAALDPLQRYAAVIAEQINAFVAYHLLMHGGSFALESRKDSSRLTCTPCKATLVMGPPPDAPSALQGQQATHVIFDEANDLEDP